jgi:Domain of unknown function (DUF892)
VRQIAWKAQMRLCARFPSLARKGKRPTVVATAIARELSAFIWAYYAENKLIKSLPEMISKTTDPQLKQAFEKHLGETRTNAKRLEDGFRMHGSSRRQSTARQSTASSKGRRTWPARSTTSR